MDKSHFENQFRDLIGKKIVRVRYYEIDYQDTLDMWSSDDRFDSLDFGLDLLTDDNSLFAISWGSEFYNMEYHLTKTVCIHQKDIDLLM